VADHDPALGHHFFDVAKTQAEEVGQVLHPKRAMIRSGSALHTHIIPCLGERLKRWPGVVAYRKTESSFAI
jgi:hypothetical protein